MQTLEKSGANSDAKLGDKLILYDGVCGFCNRKVQYVLKRDRGGKFKFAPLQGNLAHEILRKHGKDPEDLNSVYLVLNPGKPGEQIFDRGQAVHRILSELSFGSKVLALFRFLPTKVCDWAYNFVARRRYKWYGKYDACPMPSQEQRQRFVGMEGVKLEPETIPS
jgi:predicted DCC family thiol-disulfide oxidoreductase YuxK